MTFVSYAQNYEDLVLWRALKDVTDGFYIDVGAADPKVFSVTHAFYQRGWHGINIEPTAEPFALLAAERVRDINIKALIGDRPGIALFYEFASLGLSTMNNAIADRHIQAGLAYSTVSLPIITLASVSETRGTQPIHFLKVDVEGAEREVLLNMDFSKCRPWIVVVEATEPMNPSSTKEQWEDIVTRSDYIFAYFDGLNCYYVAREHKELIRKLAVAPNVFDDFIKADELAFREQAEDWRLRLIASIQENEEARSRLVASIQDHEETRSRLSSDADRAHQEIARLIDDVAWSKERLTKEQAYHATIEDGQQELAARLEALHKLLDQSNCDIEKRSRYIGELEQQLRALWASFSWRVTAPMRKVSRRFPGLARALRRFASRHPRLRRPIVTILRRLAGRPALAAPVIAAEAIAAPEAVPITTPAGPRERLIPPDAKNWMFMGDTIDWLETHAQLSGVGKVTSELFFASLETSLGAGLLPCAAAQTPVGLAFISARDTASYLAARCGIDSGRVARRFAEPDGTSPKVLFVPAAGDHVLFTGVVWTEHYTALFLSLAQAGIRFSVFVYDIIPIVNPEFVDPSFPPMFKQWLRTVLINADCVFVSSEGIKDQILRWAALSNVYVSASVSAVDFGTKMPLAPDDLPAGPAISGVRTTNFVLSVGTIDRRKNQALLARVWQRLIADLGREVVPQLVLVGRDDLNLGRYEPTRPSLESGDILVLQGVTDEDLVTLYRSCQFTAFPSLSEGYGLPVSESHAFGKLCVGSDLPVIREHAGDLPWYFAADDEDAAYAVLRRAIADRAARQATEAEIAARYQHYAWTGTFDAMATRIAGTSNRRAAAAPEQLGLLEILGVERPAVIPALAAAQRWCVEVDPDVSILIINWHAAALTRACIQHIWANTADVRYEIIIADNGSGAAELRALEALGSGVRLLPLSANRFFGEACNIAAEQARGRVLCLLNNDCFGEPGWLAALVKSLDADPSVGAAGPLFLFPDRTVQEAGGTIDESGYPIRFGRGDRLQPGSVPDYLRARQVDYISAAALVISREAYWRVGGFDLGYEPAYYEDTDLCFKLRVLGLSVQFCPDARAVHIEGASANADPVAEARRRALGDLNRGKFVSRWGRYLKTRTEADLVAVAEEIFVNVPAPVGVRGRRRATLYTPYALTPGGGERFLLTIASMLMRDYDVTVVTPQPYSQLRLLNLGFEFDIDLSECRPLTEAAFLAAPAPDLMITVGNQIVPPIEPRTENSFFICQFPFPMDAAVVATMARWKHGYRRIIAYSDYAKAHITAALSAFHMPPWPVEVVYPAVPQVAGVTTAKKPIILTVGRFFAGGHNKRHDVMITAFRKLHEAFGGEVEMHLAGSSMPDPMHMKYLDDLMQMTDGIPVTFHVNASRETLTGLYRDAAVYWHATGLDADLVREPGLAEHFGISLVEAMNAECVPLAFNAGGPREIIADGISGYLYNSVDDLVRLTGEVMRPGNETARMAMGEAAGRRARDFTLETFQQRIRAVLGES